MSASWRMQPEPDGRQMPALSFAVAGCHCTSCASCTLPSASVTNSCVRQSYENARPSSSDGTVFIASSMWSGSSIFIPSIRGAPYTA